MISTMITTIEIVGGSRSKTEKRAQEKDAKGE